jgi:CBS domain-containing protein
VAQLMADRRLSRLVVLEGGDLVGIITMNDIVSDVLAMAEKAHIDET